MLPFTKSLMGRDNKAAASILYKMNLSAPLPTPPPKNKKFQKELGERKLDIKLNNFRKVRYFIFNSAYLAEILHM